MCVHLGHSSILWILRVATCKDVSPEENVCDLYHLLRACNKTFAEWVLYEVMPPSPPFTQCHPHRFKVYLCLGCVLANHANWAPRLCQIYVGCCKYLYLIKFLPKKI